MALTHFAYFPGAALTAAAWRLLPSPWDDYRLFVLLATIGCVLAVLLFPAPPAVRLALGAAVALSPLLVRGAWFGTADAPSLCASSSRSHCSRARGSVWAAGFLAGAVLLKQFALVAVPFFAVMLLQRRVDRTALTWSAVVFAAVLAAGFLPFLLADPRARLGGHDRLRRRDVPDPRLRPLGDPPQRRVIDDRYGDYPFAWLVALVWLPLTLYLLWQQRRATSWGGRGRVRGLDLRAALHRARLPDVVPGLAAGRGRARRLHWLLRRRPA